ncbi:glycoside hydrolase family 38 C-terminal domain-containing protein [Isoptericola hypogeus]|uniref:Glycoside hydrolase family 38 C-terminal domain-containing protein n=1 Tax=Isoptericola hypogeus TaxID=300179 RepID=A0ABP4VQN2_9MICO
MHDTTARTTARLERFVHDWLEPAVHRARRPLDVAAWTVGGEPVPFAEAASAAYEPHPIGSPWGRPWDTVWFRVTGTVPAEWRGAAAPAGTRAELVVDLGFTGAGPGFQAEGTAWTTDGRIIKAVEPRNQHVPLVPGGALTAADDGTIDLFVEAAANPDVPGGAWTRPTPMGAWDTAGSEPIYALRTMHVALVDETVTELLADVRALAGLVRVLPATSPRAAEVLRALEDMLDAVDPDDVSGTAAAGRAALAGALASPAAPSAHRVHAVGHAHIDSAWLWPTRETVRKCARTFSNVLALMDADPDVKFACSSAQQYSWVQEHYPELFERIRERVREGRFVPVGGMWVESDTNMPGGEALARQLVAGKRYFIEELGVEPGEVWLPDSFGYTGALPQLARLAGSENFLTQKISWNDTNTMPHHTFWWEGIDGSRVFTHFPPVDTYNSDLSAEELGRAERQYAEKGRANTSLAPFGYGDGGGGPTREMVAQARRTADLEGSPRVTLSDSQSFFDAARAEYDAPPTWVGEMYLEYHRGTYTSQARTKRGNRRSEHLLREAELWAATAAVRVGAEYPAKDLERIWHTVLLQQFHDILPGSSIAWVHREAERNYAAVAAELEAIVADALAALVGAGDREVAVNAGPFQAAGVPALGARAADARGAATPATLRREDDGWVLENDAVRVVVDADGLVTSAVDAASGRDAILPGARANLLQLHRDVPNEWEAWDIDQHYRRNVTDLVAAESVEQVDGEHGPALRVVRSFGSSRVEQLLELSPGAAALRITTRVDWHERQKLLKLAFPVDVHAERAASEIQFGHVYRPTHANTSWDHARFETVAHRWVHVGEPGFGVAVANDSTYGHDIARTHLEAVTDEAAGAAAGGRTGTTVRLSLLRAPMFPDPDADQGSHELRCELVVGAGIDDAIRHGYALNLPERVVRGERDVEPLVSVDDDAVVVEAVKLAEDGSGDVVVRLYESRGGRARARLTPRFEHSAVDVTDLLERPVAAAERDGDDVLLALSPFQVVTLRVRR